jgi:serine/threonine protein kinase
MQCNPSLLWTLVEQSEEPGSESEAIARHVESCDRCRAELAQYGGEEVWWDEAREWLSCGVDQRMDEPADLLPLPAVDLSFLESPSHPEMLGRIGRYDVQGLLGRGGMGVVLRAYDSDLQRTVAVKVLAPEWAASEAARLRFAREAQAAASVAHENVIPIYNVEAAARLPFLVMRYVPGVTLEKWVRSNGALDTPTMLRVAGQMAEGLAAAHRRGLVHRDIKPGNVLVGENIERVWITDFGLARAADSATLTRTGVIAGTPHYMSPEQARGEAIDHRSDLFSLGCVLYFISAGRPPFDAENTLAVLHKIVSERAEPLTSVRQDLPPSYVELVHQLLRRSVDRRPHDCQAVIESLSQAQAEIKLGRVARQSPYRHKRIWLAAIAATLLVIAASAGMLNNGRSGTDHRNPDMTNPWSIGNLESDVDPYVAAASERIDTAAIYGHAEFAQEVARIDRELDRIEAEFDRTLTPSMRMDNQRWRRNIAELEKMLRKLESP